MRQLLTVSLVASTLLINAQQVDWLASWPMAFGANPAMTDQVLASAPGHLVGMRQATGTFIYGSTVYGEALLERLDPANGEAMWSCSLFDTVNVESAVVSPDGMAYFAGRFMGNLGLCDGSIIGSIPGQPTWTENLFLIAVDLNTGLIDWTRNLSFVHDQAVSISSLALDPQGRLWYALAEWGVGKAVRVDADGNDMETRIVDGVRTLGTISFDPWGGLYMSGSVDDAGFAFGGQAFQGYGSSGYNMFVLRYRPDGTAGFAQFAEDVTFQDPTVVVTSDGHAYLAGDLLTEATDWGGITFNGPNWVNDVFLTKLDSTGQFLWGAESAPDGGPITGDMYRAKGPCIAVDANDQVYLMGTLRGQVDWGNGVVSNGLTVGAQTLSVVAFASDGTPQWAATSTPGGMFNQAQTLTAMAEEGALHFAGHITSQFTFGAHTTNTGGTQAAMVGRMGGLSTGVRERDAAQALALWPVPAGDVAYLELEGKVAQPAELLNGAGQRVADLTLNPGRNTIELGGLPGGLYLLRTGEGEAVRVVKE